MGLFSGLPMSLPSIPARISAEDPPGSCDCAGESLVVFLLLTPDKPRPALSSPTAGVLKLGSRCKRENSPRGGNDVELLMVSAGRVPREAVSGRISVKSFLSVRPVPTLL